MDILGLLKNMDKDTLEKSIKEAQRFLSTPEGQNTAKMISEGKMPDGSQLPDELKDMAKAISKDENARSVLGELTRQKK